MNKKRIIRFVIGILFIVASIVIFETIREIQSKSGTFEDVILSQNPDVYFSAAELEQFDENMTKRTVIRGNQFIDMFNYLKNLQIQPEFPQKSAQVGYDYALSLFGKKNRYRRFFTLKSSVRG